MIIWLLVLLLLTLSVYVIYKISFITQKDTNKKTHHHYTFKIKEE